MTSTRATPLERLADVLADDMAQVNALIRARMMSENAPKSPRLRRI